jgi:hypothetical protein
MAETELKSCLVVGFGISSIDPMGYTTRELISSFVVFVVS